MVSAVGLLNHIQNQLEAIYDLPHPVAVSDYLVDRRSLEAAGVSVRAAEEVLLHESEAGLDLGLYLAPELFERLRGKDPRQSSGLSLVTEDLSAFAVVAEGVSHVVYLLRCAEHERQVSKLELEVQAEVDKFAISAMHLWGRNLRAHVAELWERLFARVSLHPALTADERERYLTAGALARGYARKLIEQYVVPGKLDEFLADLRLTYRLTAGDKLRAFSVG